MLLYSYDFSKSNYTVWTELLLAFNSEEQLRKVRLL